MFCQLSFHRHQAFGSELWRDRVASSFDHLTPTLITFIDVSDHYWTVSGQDRATVAHVERNTVWQKMKCVTVHCRRGYCRLADVIWHLDKTTNTNSSQCVRINFWVQKSWSANLVFSRLSKLLGAFLDASCCRFNVRFNAVWNAIRSTHHNRIPPDELTHQHTSKWLPLLSLFCECFHSSISHPCDSIVIHRVKPDWSPNFDTGTGLHNVCHCSNVDALALVRLCDTPFVEVCCTATLTCYSISVLASIAQWGLRQSSSLN